MDTHGVRETNPITDDIHRVRESIDHAVPPTDWADKRLARIVRLRLLSDPGFPMWDVSYCYGQLHDGTHVRVALPFSQLPKRKMMAALIAYAKADGVYLRGLGVFDALSTLV
jgi:hypothetical protein